MITYVATNIKITAFKLKAGYIIQKILLVEHILRKRFAIHRAILSNESDLLISANYFEH